MMNVRERIAGAADTLTGTERKLSTTLLADYPFAGLEPIQALAERTAVSAPSISRFVTKLGFQGYQDFQRHLIAELKEGQRSPIDLITEGRELAGTYLEDFTHRATALLEETARAIPESQFLRICDLLGDPTRRIFAMGGRISDLIAQHLSRHLRRIRSDVHHLSGDPETWPDDLLRMRNRDVLFVVDFRRYQQTICDLAMRAATQRRARVIVLTDKWMSPAVAHASETLAVPVESGTVWDSYAAAFTLMEAMMTRIAEADWQRTRARLGAWDGLLPATGDDADAV